MFPPIKAFPVIDVPPLTCKAPEFVLYAALFPNTVNILPINAFPLIPAPPTTCRAPELASEEAKLERILILPPT